MTCPVVDPVTVHSGAHITRTRIHDDANIKIGWTSIYCAFNMCSCMLYQEKTIQYGHCSSTPPLPSQTLSSYSSISVLLALSQSSFNYILIHFSHQTHVNMPRFVNKLSSSNFLHRTKQYTKAFMQRKIDLLFGVCRWLSKLNNSTYNQIKRRIEKKEED